MYLSQLDFLCSEFDASVVNHKISIHCNSFFLFVCSVFITFMNMISDLSLSNLSN